MLTENGWTWEYVMDMPLARAFAIAACRHKRDGGQFDSPDYKQLDQLEKLRIAEEENG